MSMTPATMPGNRDVPAASDDADGDLPDAVDTALQPIAALHRADTGRRAGEDQIARLEGEEAGEMADHLRNLPDELREIAVLPQLAVDLEPHRAGGRMTDRGGRHDFRARGGGLERLADLPWPTQLLGLGLQVAAGHVEADGIAVDAVERAFDRNVDAAAAERHHHLQLVMDIGRFRRIGEVAAAGN